MTRCERNVLVECRYLELEHVALPENVAAMSAALCVGLLTWRALYLLYMVVCIVLSEMSGTGGRELNSPLQLLRTSLVVVGVLFVCDNLGFQVKSLIAGISIAGLCSQALLQDAFAFIALTVESPFQVGDVVMVKGQERGFVESVGLRTTIIRSVTGGMAAAFCLSFYLFHVDIVCMLLLARLTPSWLPDSLIIALCIHFLQMVKPQASQRLRFSTSQRLRFLPRVEEKK